MALVRIYCGVATAEMPPWLTVAVVDDSGRLLEMRHISDDPAGYAYLGAVLAERSGGSAPVAIDSHEHLVAQLLAAANRPVAIADETVAVDLADRFADDTSYDELQAPVSQRRAVGLARALQAGALYATAQSPSVDLDEIKPVLAAHGAVTAGRQAAAAALREVLRELYPAALRAYPDPADYVPLAILDALPEPGLLTRSPSSRNREAAIVENLCGTGAIDPQTAANAITALRVAVEESPRWAANRLLAPVVADTVRQAVAAVRACDGASAVLIASLAERLSAMGVGLGSRPYLVPSAPTSPAVGRPGPAAEVPPSRFAPRGNVASAAAAGLATTFPMGTGVTIPGPRTGPGQADTGDPGFGAPPRPEWTPAQWTPPQWTPPEYAPGYADLPPHARGSDDTAAGHNPAGHAAEAVPPGYSPPPYPGHSPHPATRSSAPLHGAPGSAAHAADPAPSPGEPRETGVPGQVGPVPPYTFEDSSNPTLSFELDPLNAPLEPPPLRVVASAAPDPLTDPLPQRGKAPPLRVIDGGEASPASQRPKDDDLLIFSETSSAWFTSFGDVDIDRESLNWSGLADDGWRAAEQLGQPAVGDATTAGLPRRVPQANLVPGSPHPPDRHLRIARDPRSIADHTDGYFRGWRRGQEIGGFAVGQRDRAAWEFNREQRLRDDAGHGARLS